VFAPALLLRRVDEVVAVAHHALPGPVSGRPSRAVTCSATVPRAMRPSSRSPGTAPPRPRTPPRSGVCSSPRRDIRPSRWSSGVARSRCLRGPTRYPRRRGCSSTGRSASSMAVAKLRLRSSG
jgi:hypothetical protein